jgi:hypothetical protein
MSGGSSASGGGTQDHSALDNLDYASSGHTGFLEDANDVINDTHIDWGTGANQVSADDIPDGATNAIPTLVQESSWDTAYGWGDHAGLYELVDTCLKLDQTTPQTITGGVPIGLEGSYTHKITFNMIGTADEQAWVQVPYNCTITSYELTADQSGSIVIDLWKDTYANFPPTVADTITASAKPTLSSAQKATDSTLTGWTKTLSAGDYILANVDSASTLAKAVLTINVTRS